MSLMTLSASALALVLASLTPGQDGRPGRAVAAGRVAHSQGGGGRAAALMNLAGCPLTLSITENRRHILLSNRTSQRVIGYRLGAVSVKKGVPAVIKLTKLIAVNLDVKEAAINPKEVEDKLDYCRRKKARLAVIEVTFAHGAVWEGKI